MEHSHGDWIDTLAEAQRPGWSLEAPFYRDPEIFERERERIFANQWIMAGHVSQVPEVGDYFLFDMAGENIIVMRGRAGQVHAHHNVCRHRGSRVLLDSTGHVSAMTCGYHGWRYALDGSLQAAPRMPEDFDRSCFGLRICPLVVLEGLIFVCLGSEPAPDFGPVEAGLEPFLQLHGIAGATLAQRRIFPVDANWKLAAENYLECYHCKPAHREYCSVEIKAEKIGDGSAAAMVAYEQREREWRPVAESLDAWLPEFACPPACDGDWRRAQFGAAYRAPLRATHQTGTRDGRPAAPLLDGFRDYDGGETALGVGPFTYMLAYNDHATFFQFVPRDAVHSDMVVTWLVRGGAKAGEDYDLEELTWLWTVTTEQDKSIIEANAAGVASPSYAPGPPSLLEGDLEGFRGWYLAMIGPEQARELTGQTGGSRYFGSRTVS